jgi:hypothetical protein
MVKKYKNINTIPKKVNKRLGRKMAKKQFTYKNGNYFEVERICAKKLENGITYYNVKWEGWPESTNTWEPLTHLLNVKDLVLKYDMENGNDIPEELNKQESDKESIVSIEDPYGSFENGDVPKKILKMKILDGEYLALVEWAIRPESGLKPINNYINRVVLRKKKPLLLIDYYESKMKWVVFPTTEIN